MTTQNEKSRIGLALSGGGHRATLFALGVLIYLWDSRRCANITSISSVSGGSITNAFLCLMEKPFSEMNSMDFDSYAASLARQIAGRPIFFWASLFSYLIALILLAVDILLDWRIREAAMVYPVAIAISPVLLSMILGPHSLGTLWSWWGTWAYIGSIFATLLLALWLPIPIWARAAAILFAVVSTIFRPYIASVAIGRSIEDCSGWRERHDECAQLAGVQSDLVHAFCATDMHDGEHVYFCSNNVVFSPSFGIGTAGNLTLRAAAQASANLPGAFPPRLMRANRYSFEGERLFAERRRVGPVLSDWPSPFKTLVLTDGGVRDNLALTWHKERKRTAESLRAFAKNASEINASYEQLGLKRQWLVKDPERLLALANSLSDGSADDIVAVNAAYTPAAWTVPFSWVPALGELYSFLKLPTTFYHRTNRQATGDFRRDLFLGKVRGALISIDNTPIDMAGYVTQRLSYFSFPTHEPEFDFSSFESRAKEVWDYDANLLGGFLGTEVAGSSERYRSSRRYFREIVAACRDEGTHLNPIGRIMASKLLFHGYTSAMTNLHILDGSYPLMVRAPRLDDFVALAKGERRPAKQQVGGRV